MRHLVAALGALALVAVAGSSSSAPPVAPAPSDPPNTDRREPDHTPPQPSECKGYPCAVSPYSGNLPAEFELAKMQKLGCDAPFNHVGGIRVGETSWVGFSCPEHVARQFHGALNADFSDSCLPKRAGRAYVPVFEGKCSFDASNASYEGPLGEKAKKLGCGPIVRYMTGNSNAMLGGLGAYCPITPALKNANMTGYPSGYCDGCLKVPPGRAFVMFEFFVGPNCPGGCASSPGPTKI